MSHLALHMCVFLVCSVRISNLMNVLLNDTVADPSAMEAKVRAQMLERKTDHEAANASRKLTPEQKAEKIRRKYFEDVSHEVHVAVYRAGNLEDGKARYKIDVNAQKWNLSGLALLHPECNVVIVEGGPKNQRRFRGLMLKRIKWKKRGKSAMELEEEMPAWQRMAMKATPILTTTTTLRRAPMTSIQSHAQLMAIAYWCGRA
jgi:hypothetical protein